MPDLPPGYRAQRRPLKRARVHRYIDRFDSRRHTLEVPFPAWAWRLMVRYGASRDPLEISADRSAAERASGSLTPRVDYWAETEAPK